MSTNPAAKCPPSSRLNVRAGAAAGHTESVEQVRELVPRKAAALVAEALADTRVVTLNGARQTGKSTLARLAAQDRPGALTRLLDDPATLRAARDDPATFAEHDDLLVIDEVQLAPELFRTIKVAVDTDQRPGQFLLTGSAQILALRDLPDALPGRMEIIELWPFSQGEIDGLPEGFVDAAFTDPGALNHTSAVSRGEYAERILRGGFPEAVARANPARRERFFDSYVGDLIARDVSQLSEIERPAQLRALLHLLAARSGQLLVGNALSSDLQVSARTVHRYLSLLEEIFLIKRIPAWSRNVSSRAIGTPKVAFVDSGVAGNLLDADARSLLRPGGPFGPLLEGFVLMELARQLTWSRRRAELFHYRTKDGTEVDAVLEDRQGRVVGIEVKASSTVRIDDFRGLRHLADRLGADFVAGLVLYTGTQTLPFGPRLRAVPASALWEIVRP